MTQCPHLNTSLLGRSELAAVEKVCEEGPGLAGCIQVGDVPIALCVRETEGMAWQVMTLWLSMPDNARMLDGHRCQGSEEVGNRGNWQPRASLAISPIQCLTTKGKAIKANSSDSLGADTVVEKTHRFSMFPLTPCGLTPIPLPSSLLSDSLLSVPQYYSHSSDQLCLSLPLSIS